MNKCLSKIQGLRSGRNQRSLQWWERERAKGKARYILRTGLTVGVMVVAVADILKHLSGSSNSASDLLFTLFWYVGVGFISAFFAWNSWEQKYQKALQEARASSPHGPALPHSKS